MTLANNERLFAAREDSPLVLGVGENSYYLASDVPAFFGYTRDMVYLDDGEFVIVSQEGYQVSDANETSIEKYTTIVN